MSEVKPTVVEALSRVMADVQAVKKADRNKEQNYSFRGIDSVVNAVGPALREHGVLVVPLLEDSSWRDVRTSRDKPARECTVKVRYRFYGPAGDYLDATTPGESMDFGDKGAAKAMSVAFRIALLQALCIPTDEPDADSHTYERAGDWEQAKPAREPVVVQPPTSEQVGLYERLLADLTAAATLDALTVVGRAVYQARAEGSIIQAQYDDLGEKGLAKKAELQAEAA